MALSWSGVRWRMEGLVGAASSNDGPSVIAGCAVTAGMAARVQQGWQRRCSHGHLWLLPLPCLHTLLAGEHGRVLTSPMRVVLSSLPSPLSLVHPVGRTCSFVFAAPLHFIYWYRIVIILTYLCFFCICMYNSKT
jgi:hypothetical protein